METLCDRIAVLKDGDIIFCGTASELTEKIGQKYLIHVKTNQGIETYETNHIEDALLSLLGSLKQKGLRILDIKVDRGSLEEHFMEMVRRK